MPLSTQAAAILAVRDGGCATDFVFGRDGTGFSGWSRAKARLDAAVGLSEPWVIHDIRRSVVTGMAEIGIAPHVIEAAVNHISGHKGGVAGVYNKAQYSQEKRAALQRWADHLDRVVGEALANVVEFAR